MSVKKKKKKRYWRLTERRGESIITGKKATSRKGDWDGEEVPQQ